MGDLEPHEIDLVLRNYGGTHHKDEVEREDHKFRDDLYEFAVCAIIRDSFMLSQSKGRRMLRMSRVVFVLLLLYMNIFVQVFLVTQIKMFVSAPQVANIRSVYGMFQETMYGEELLEKTVNGYYRVVDGKQDQIQPGNFDSFDDDTRDDICEIPLSQPWYLCVVIFIWTLTCAGEFDNALRFSRRLIYRLPTSSTVSGTIKILDLDKKAPDYKKNVRLIHQLPLVLKFFVGFAVVLPQLGISGYLLWLGSRWLTATNSFSDLMLNAVALEFIFLLKDLFYRTIISERNKLDIENTEILCTEKRVNSTLHNLFESLVWVPLCLLWVRLYVFHFQAVLPEYRWDVHRICSSWIAVAFKV